MLQSTNRAFHLAFCTDGEPAQLLGIAMIIGRLRNEIFRLSKGCHLWIAAPHERHESVRQTIGSIIPHQRLQLLTATTNIQDRYFVQLSLTKVFFAVDPHDLLLCIDYDHIVRSPLGDLFDCQPEYIMLSSEVRHDNINNYEACYKFSSNPRMAQLNTSFIFGDAKALARIGNRWLDSYFELEPHVNERYLVEIAFGLAALRSGIIVNPCKSSIQGNFATPNQRCKLFHYGGDSKVALKLKKILQNIAVKNIEHSNKQISYQLAELLLRNKIEEYLLNVNP